VSTVETSCQFWGAHKCVKQLIQIDRVCYRRVIISTKKINKYVVGLKCLYKPP